MARVSDSLTSFNNGVITPRLYGHTDFAKYRNSLTDAKNMLFWRQGPVNRRSGFRHVNTVKTSSKDTVIQDFEFSTTQTYVIEFGDLYVRFFANRGFIETVPASGIPYEIVSLYPEADLRQLRFTQSADVLFITHPDHKPRRLNRVADNSWNFTDIVFEDGPYQDQNTDDTMTLQSTATSGTVTITAAGHTPFLSTDVGRLIRIKGNAAWGYAEITVFNSTTSVDALVKEDFENTDPAVSWRLGAFSDSTGYPEVATFHQERLVFGGGVTTGTGDGPQKVWMSKTGDFFNFAPTELDDTVSDDNAVTFGIATDQVNAIKWMRSSRSLMIGTTGAEFKLSAVDNGVITPSNITVTRESRHGSSGVPPVLVGSGVVFLQRAGRKLRELDFEFVQDAFRAPDISLFFEHLTVGGIKQMAYQQEPDSIIWMVLNDGTLISFTYDKDQNVLAAGSHPLGGTLSKAVSVASIVSETTNRDELWLISEREVNGVIQKSVGFLENEFDHDTDIEDGFFVDDGLTLDVPFTVTGATQADPVVITTAAAHGFVTGDFIKPRGVLGMTELNNKSFKVTNETATTFEITDKDDVDIDGTGFTAYKSGGKVRKEITTITGLGHAEGEVVAVLTDGANHPTKTVSGGSITLDIKASIVHVGHTFSSLIKTLSPEVLVEEGGSQGRKGRIYQMTARVYRSLGLKFGPDETKLEIQPFRSTSDDMDAPPPLTTADLKIVFNAGYDNKTRQAVILQDNPHPLTVLGLITRMNINEP